MRKRSQTRILCLLAAILSIAEAWALPARLGDMDEDGIASIHDLVRILNHIHGRVPFHESRISFADLNRDGLVNAADVDQVADAIVAGLALAEIDFSPQLSPVVPFTDSDRFTFTGTNFPRTRVRLSSSTGSFEVESDNAGSFTFDLPLSVGRSQEFYVAGFDASGAVLSRAPIVVLQDSQGPELAVTFPDGTWSTSSDSIVVCGQLSDSLTGYLGMAVTVAGIAAEVYSGDGLNGSFMSSPVSLNLGANVIPVRAIDAAGNETSHDLSVTRVALEDFRLEKSLGDAQTAVIGEYLTDPVVVRLVGPGGAPLAGKALVFEIVGGVGGISSPGATEVQATIQAVTNASGHATVRWKMGAVAGKGNHLLRVTSRDLGDGLVFVASADPKSSVRLYAASRNGQKGVVGSRLATPLRVWVNDGGNALAGRSVKFSVVDGAGKVNGQDEFTVSSGAAGFAEVQFTFGPNPGGNTIAASVLGEANTTLLFALDGMLENQLPTTSLRGVVMTPFFEAISGAQLELLIEGMRFGPVTSDDSGAFAFESLNSGAAELQAWLPNGSTSQVAPFTPIVRRDLLLTRGINNSLDQVLILPMTFNRATFAYDGTSDLRLVLPGNEGFSIVIPAGAVQTRDGGIPSLASPVPFSLTQVPTSSLPARPANGETPRIAWLLEPSDVVFTSTPTLTVPDLAGLKGASSIGVFGMDQRGKRFDRFTSLRAVGSPTDFRNSIRLGGIPAGFAFVSAGYQSGRATVASTSPISPSAVE